MGDALRTDGLLGVGISDMRRFRAGEGDIPRVLILVADEVVVRAKEGEGSSDIRLREEDGEAAAMALVLPPWELPYCGGIGRVALPGLLCLLALRVLPLRGISDWRLLAIDAEDGRALLLPVTALDRAAAMDRALTTERTLEAWLPTLKALPALPTLALSSRSSRLRLLRRLLPVVAEAEAGIVDRDEERERMDECVGRAKVAIDLRLPVLAVAVAGLFLAADALLLAVEGAAVPQRAVLAAWLGAVDGRGLLDDAATRP